MRGATLLILAGLLFWLNVRDAAAQNGRPDEVLTERYGLSKLPATNVWVVPAETELRELWADIGRQRDATVALEQALAERIQRNARDWVQVEKKETTLRLGMATLDPRNREARAQFAAQIKALRSTAAPPARLGDLEEVREQLTELSGRRTTVWLTARGIRRQTSVVVETYEALAKDERLGELLKKMGANHRLGPARGYVEDLKKLPDFDHIYEQDWLPLVVLGDRLRFTGLVNDATPITFSWVTSSEPATLTASMAEAAGIKPRTDSPIEQITLAGKTYTTQSASIPYLRLGRHELRDVPVLVLPPEAEFAGARLGPMALTGYLLEPQPDRLRIVVSKRNE